MNKLYLAFSAISDTQYKSSQYRSSSHCFILIGKELYVLTLSYNTLFVSFLVFRSAQYFLSASSVFDFPYLLLLFYFLVIC